MSEPFDAELAACWIAGLSMTRRYELKRPQAGVVRSSLDASGRTGLQKSDFGDEVDLTLLNEDLRA